MFVIAMGMAITSPMSSANGFAPDGVDNKVVVENSAVEQNICYARAEQKRFFADLARQDIDERIGHYADAY